MIRIGRLLHLLWCSYSVHLRRYYIVLAYFQIIFAPFIPVTDCVGPDSRSIIWVLLQMTPRWCTRLVTAHSYLNFDADSLCCDHVASSASIGRPPDVCLYNEHYMILFDCLQVSQHSNIVRWPRTCRKCARRWWFFVDFFNISFSCALDPANQSVSIRASDALSQWCLCGVGGFRLLRCVVELHAVFVFSRSIAVLHQYDELWCFLVATVLSLWALPSPIANSICPCSHLLSHK
jgi:hypothetical protein